MQRTHRCRFTLFRLLATRTATKQDALTKKSAQHSAEGVLRVNVLQRVVSNIVIDQVSLNKVR